MKVHLLKKRWPDNRGLTSCGISIDRDHWTRDVRNVACERCQDTHHWIDEGGLWIGKEKQ